MLEIIANFAEIIAGVAIVVAAIRAWPVFSDMQRLVGHRQWDKKKVKADLQRLAEAGQKRGYGGDTGSPVKTMDDAVEMIMQLAQGNGLVHFEILNDDEEFPGRVRIEQARTNPTTFCRLTLDGHQSLLEALKRRYQLDAQQPLGSTYIEYQGFFYVLNYVTGLRGASALMNAFPGMTADWTVDELGINRGRVWQKLQPALDAARGMIIVSGIPGSGKSTTLPSLVNYVAQSERHNIVSITDPLEFPIRHAVELTHASTGLDDPFELVERAIGLSPTVMVVGLLGARNIPAAWTTYGRNMLLLATITGREALAGLFELNRHATFSAHTISEPLIFLGQNLLERPCVHCAVREPFTEDEQRLVDEIFAHDQAVQGFAVPTQTTRAIGCDKCGDGYHGRVAVIEYLEVSQPVQDAAAAGASIATLRELAGQHGMISAQCEALLMAAKGVTSIQEVWRLSDLLDYPIRPQLRAEQAPSE